MEQLQENRWAITSGLENFITDDETPETSTQAAKLPITMPAGLKSNLDSGFRIDEIEVLMKYTLSPPSQIMV